MKRILITGKDSYVGTEFEKYSNKNESLYEFTTVDMIGDEWLNVDFSQYDVVFHLAAIVHNPSAPSELYYKVNTELAVQVAKKAKSAGVKQFVLMSSMSVFGKDIGVIDEETKPVPNNDYGRSKLNADIQIKDMASDNFIVSIIRAPMIYGKGCKGNYNLLEKFALSSPIFPSLDNNRDMIYILNLCYYLSWVIDNRVGGMLYPTDPELVSTARMVQLVANTNGKKIWLIGIFNPFIRFFRTRIRLLALVFGDNYCTMAGKKCATPYSLEDAIFDIYENKN